MSITKNELISIGYACSEDITRASINYIRVEKINDYACRLLATNGHVMMIMEDIDYDSLRIAFNEITSHMLDQKFESSFNLVPNFKALKRLHKVNVNSDWVDTDLIYPKWKNIIPEKFENPIETTPILNGIVSTLANKIVKKGGFDVGFLGFQYWNGMHEVTMTTYRNYVYLGLMPTRSETRTDKLHVTFKNEVV